MADTKISNLAAVTTVDDTDAYVVARSGASKKITGANLKKPAQDALDAHTGDTSAAHAASAISADSTTLVGTGTDVQAVLEELDNGVADHLADTSAAHAASAISFSPTGTVASTDVQAAIAEVASEATAPSFATPAVVLGSSAAAGAAGTVIRSDGTIAAFDTTVPSTQAFGDAAAVGTAAFAARRDHKHAMPAVVPLNGSVINSYYTTMIGGGTWVNKAQVLNLMICTPIWLEAGTLDRLAQEHNATTAAGETARLGLYADNGRGIPGALVVDGGTIDLSTATGVKTVTISNVITRGLYWLALVRQGGGVLAQLIGPATTFNIPQVLLPQRAPAGTHLYEGVHGWSIASVTGGLPDPFTGTVASGFSDIVTPAFVRYSA
jgi:hypothetical protein